jgi:hypothetical protein
MLVAVHDSLVWSMIAVKLSQLLSHYFDQDSFVALAIKLGIKNLLPPAEVESSFGDGYDHLVVHEHRF